MTKSPLIAWTSRLLDSPLALDPMIGSEVVKTIASFLDARRRALPHRAAEELAGESQDDFGMFDIDFADPALDALLGVERDGPAESPQDQLKVKEQAFAQASLLLLTLGRPLLTLACTFTAHQDQLVACLLPTRLQHPHPRPHRARRTYRRRSQCLRATDCRVLDPLLDRHDRERRRRKLRCSSVAELVDAMADRILRTLQDWSGYLRYGDHSWKRISEPLGRRDIGLLLAIQILGHDSTVFPVSFTRAPPYSL